MSTEQLTRRVNEILRRLDELEAQSKINYTKGTYTPTYVGGTTAGTTTYAANGQVGEWTRIGRLVYFTGRVEWTAATGTGNARISIPFTASNRTNLNWVVSLALNNVTFANGSPTGLINANTAYFDIRSPQTNAGSTISAVEAAGIVNFTGFFSVD